MIWRAITSAEARTGRLGKTTESIAWGLGPRESMQMDCSDIYNYLGIAPGTFIDGFVYFIAEPFRFTATAVYAVTVTVHVRIYKVGRACPPNVPIETNCLPANISRADSDFSFEIR